VRIVLWGRFLEALFPRGEASAAALKSQFARHREHEVFRRAVGPPREPYSLVRTLRPAEHAALWDRCDANSWRPARTVPCD
jgi:hypothetical protein